MIKKLAAFVIIFLFIGAGVVSSSERTDIAIRKTTQFNGNLSGYVRNVSGNLIEGALVRVNFHETYEEDYSDEDGYYQVTNIPICKCLKLAVYNKEGYKPESILISIHENTVHDFILSSSEEIIELVEEIVEEIPSNYHSSVTVEVSNKALSRGNIAYGYIAGGGGGLPWGPCYFPLDDPGDITSLAPTESGDFLTGGTWVCDDRWLGCEYGTGILWEIDPETGDMWSLGGGIQGNNGLSYNTVNEKLYLCTGYFLYGFDITKDEQYLRCSFSGEPSYIIGIAFDETGNLYGWDSDNLWIIDIETCEGTLVGPHGIDISYGYGHFDFKTDILYISTSTSTGQLYKCDEDTGECTLVGDFESSAEITALAIPYEYDYSPPNTTHSLEPSEPDGLNGWYVSDLNVTLNATDYISGVKEIKYRVGDGLIQTINGDSGTFTITQEDDADDLRIEYWAIDVKGNEETPNTFYIDMDQTEPITDLTYEVIGGNPWQGWDILVELSAIDFTSGVNYTYYRIDGGEWILYTEPFILSWENIFIEYYSVDFAGNVGWGGANITDCTDFQSSGNMLLLRILERFPLLREVVLRLKSR